MTLALVGELNSMMAENRMVKNLKFDVCYETVTNTIDFNKEGESDESKYKKIEEVRPKFSVEIEFENTDEGN
jgi:hypothetical protein